MGKNFKKFKERARRHALLSALLLGLGSGILITAILMLVRKLSGFEFDMIYTLIGIGVAAVVGIALYFIFMPSDRRLARRLDKIYSLGEKVSTMVEFRGEDGMFYQLQRDDAEEKLGAQSHKEMRSKPMLTGLISFAVSVCLLTGAIFVPVKAEAEQPIDEFDKQWILASLDELIVEVQNSYMADVLKKATLDELEELVSFVEESELLSEMKAKAIDAVSGIDSALKNANTAVSIGERFTASPDQKIAKLGEGLKSLSGTESKNALAELKEAQLATDYDSIAFSASEMNSYLVASGAAPDDSIYILFKTLVSEMQNGSKDDIGEAFDDAGKKIVNEVIIQNVNASTEARVITKLCNLFGITAEDLMSEGVEVVLPERDPTDDGVDELPDDDDNNDPMGSGGLGTGDVIYGSNDMIYDPNKNTYVPYGELLNEYFAKANELITDGKASDEAAELADYYYGLLFGSYNEESN